MKRLIITLSAGFLLLALAACGGGGPATSRTLSGNFSGGNASGQSVQEATAAVQAAVQRQDYQATLEAQGLRPMAGLWAPEVKTELWSQGDTVVASRADGGPSVTASLATDGSFSLKLGIGFTYSLQLVRDGNFIAYLSNPDGTPINIKVTSAGANIELGSISIRDGKFVASNDPGLSSGVAEQGKPADFDERAAQFVTIGSTLQPSGIAASALYENAIFLALDRNNVMVGAGVAPQGQLALGVPSQALASTVSNLATFDELLLGEIQDLPANTATYAIQVPYFDVSQDFSSSLPATIDDGIWGLLEAIVVDEQGQPIKDALLGAVSVEVGSSGTPAVMVVNVGRSDSQGRVKFHLLRNLTSSDGASTLYTYSLVASRDLSADFVPLYYNDGSPALFTPTAGVHADNQFEVTLRESDKFLGTWEMDSNNQGYYGDLTISADKTATWGSKTYPWIMQGGSIYLHDGWEYSWRLDYEEGASGAYLEVHSKVTDWFHWGYAYPK